MQGTTFCNGHPLLTLVSLHDQQLSFDLRVRTSSTGFVNGKAGAEALAAPPAKLQCLINIFLILLLGFDRNYP